MDRDDRVQTRPGTAANVQLFVIELLEVTVYRASSVPSANP
jgi:hypothetical protein